MTSRRGGGPDDDPELERIENEIAIFSAAGRAFEWFFHVATLHIFDDEVRERAQDKATEMEERMDEWRAVKMAERDRYSRGKR